VTQLLTSECRRYEPTPATTDSMANELKNLSAVQVTQAQDPAPSQVGEVEKQGSGKGMFATNKWKKKLLVAHAGLAMYFDSTDISGAALLGCACVVCGGGA